MESGRRLIGHSGVIYLTLRPTHGTPCRELWDAEIIGFTVDSECHGNPKYRIGQCRIINTDYLECIQADVLASIP